MNPAPSLLEWAALERSRRAVENGTRSLMIHSVEVLRLT
jgi:hypothetical protein